MALNDRSKIPSPLPSSSPFAPSCSLDVEALPGYASLQCDGDEGGDGHEQLEHLALLHELPRRLNTKNSSNFVRVSPDKRQAMYVCVGRHGNDVGALQADRPIPTRAFVYYFEAEVLDAGRRHCIAIGFTDPSARMTRQPGWEPRSYGYHGDDGHKYHNDGRGTSYGPTFTTGDIVGAGLLLNRGEVFFTKNGEYLGVAYRNVRLPLFPTLGLHSRDEKVMVNFGQEEFKFNLAKYVREKRHELEVAMRAPVLPIDTCHTVVRNFLEHHGYYKTLRCLDEFQSLSPPDRHSTPLEETEERLRELIMAGDATGAMSFLVNEDIMPGIDKEGGSVRFLLTLQVFIELIKGRKVKEALRYARDELAPMRSLMGAGDAAKATAIDEALSLLAFASPETSTYSYLLASTRRDETAFGIISALRQWEKKRTNDRHASEQPPSMDAAAAPNGRVEPQSDVHTAKFGTQISGARTRPLSAYLLFMADFRDEYMQKFPQTRRIYEVAEAGAAKWEALGNAERKPYHERAAVLKREWEEGKRKSAEATSTENQMSNESIERALRHLSVLQNEIRGLNGYQGEVFDLCKAINSQKCD